MKRPCLKLITIVGLGILSFSVSSCKEEKKTVKPVVINFKKEGELTIKKAANDSIIKTIDIEIADDDYQTQTGMMYRDSMEDNQGMLFVFQDARFHSFYMKNTRIPLDIIYIGADKKIVSFQKNAKAFDETSLPSEAPAQYVLEINAGLADKWNLAVGDSIDYSSL
ncbi:DUF192 domain-containing protein [Subsaxibacter sp. CAU 1640]|uniref:DUF192 domain-containing protein n=1 Tax=Subsaxibacter sp. CAU 1640 TaxID=2933271 RepID=UPI002003D651|nr:DUF192 domain-containing protein [Subsaxibacter sp. CAU 1640]MCK7592038.1 DUF192 domain-containing protein [Subsaxibacter sp. CAU 1640]